MFKKFRINSLKMRIAYYTNLTESRTLVIKASDTTPFTYIRDRDKELATLGSLEKKLEILQED